MPTFRECVYNICTNTDLDDKEMVTETIAFLARNLVETYEMAMRYEAKLKELMTAKDFGEWTTQIAKEAFKADIDRMPDGAFKDFCNDHFEEITK